MRILYLGDIVGEKALDIIVENIARIKKENSINLVFANAENISFGRGLTKDSYLKLQRAHIPVLTMGNHTYSKKEIFDFIEDSNIVRPANLPGAKGKSHFIYNYNDKKILVISLLGRVFMNNLVDCPFQTLDKILNEAKYDYAIVDFHAEATSEKRALGYAFDGKISAMVGTHTHVQTADEEVLPQGTLYISDLGMCGPKDSILGDDIKQIIERFRTGVYKPSNVAKGKIVLSGAILDFNKNKIERYKEYFDE